MSWDGEDILDHPFLMIFITLLLLGILILVVFWADYSLHFYQIEITKDGQNIYSGIKSCVDIKSTGDTTTLSIHQGFLCLFPKATITARNIEVITK